MKLISRVIAEGTGRGDYIASGCYGRVHTHGDNRVYKIAKLDGTAVWLERCFAIQKRLGADHPLCEFMPEIFSFRILPGLVNGRRMYEVVMAKYERISHHADSDYNKLGAPYYCDIPQDFGDRLSDEAHRLRPVVYSAVHAVIGGYANDMHAGNILYCRKARRWVVVDPSYSTYECVKEGSKVDPKFSRAKRVVTQYGPTRRH